MPNESAAAWIVAAIRDGYDLSEAHSEDWAISMTAEEAARLSENQERQLKSNFAQARQQKAAELTGDASLDELWLDIQDQMKEDNTWAPVLASSFLKIEDGTAVILVPDVVLDHARQVQDRVADALNSAQFIRTDVEKVEMATY